MWDTAVRDLRHAARGLARSALFTLVAVATLAIGIGATTAVFSVVDGVLLKPLPYPESDRLVALWHDAPGAPGLTAVAGGLQISPSMLVTFQDENRSFEKVGAWAPRTGERHGFRGARASFGGARDEPSARGFGVPPLLGRWIGSRTKSARRRASRCFRTAIGRTVSAAIPASWAGASKWAVSTEIVGVMPRGFKFGDVAPHLIVPFPIDRAALIPPPFCCNGIARLRDGVTIEQANADVERMLPIWLERFPFPGRAITAREVYLDTWRVAPALRWFKDDVIGGVATCSGSSWP